MQILISIITALIAGFAGAYFQSYFQQRKEFKTQEQEIKLKRYLAISIQMLLLVEPEGLKNAQEFRSDFKTLGDVKKSLKDEIYNSFLFADDSVIKELNYFLENPNKGKALTVLTSMRKELWGKRTNIRSESISSLFK